MIGHPAEVIAAYQADSSHERRPHLAPRREGLQSRLASSRKVLAAVCMSVDDVASTAPAEGEAIGDTARRALEHLEWLTGRHPLLRVTLFTTPDWRSRSARPTRGWLPTLPIVRHALHAPDVLPRGTLRLDRHGELTAWLRGMRNVDFGIHGLHHVRRGPAYLQEYADVRRGGAGR